jgi:hypothetical protein
MQTDYLTIPCQQKYYAMKSSKTINLPDAVSLYFLVLIDAEVEIGAILPALNYRASTWIEYCTACLPSSRRSGDAQSLPVTRVLAICVGRRHSRGCWRPKTLAYKPQCLFGLPIRLALALGPQRAGLPSTLHPCLHRTLSELLHLFQPQSHARVVVLLMMTVSTPLRNPKTLP